MALALRAMAGWRRGRDLLPDRSGTTAVEFALVAVPFLIMVLGIMEIGYDLYVQVALDNAVQTAARSVQVGSVKGASGETSAQFVTSAVCPALSPGLDCALLTVGVKTIPGGSNYYSNPTPLTLAAASSAGGSICTGQGGQLVILQAWYAGPSFLGGLIPSFSSSSGGNLVHFTTSSAGFVNEYFSGGQSSGVGC